MTYYKSNIEEFLLSRGWTPSHSGNLFDYFQPPQDLKVSQNYLLEIANDDAKPGFQKYSKSIISVISEIYDGTISEEDLNIFFSSAETIMAFRIADDDTKYGSIQLERLSRAIENLKLVFKQTVTFLMSEKPIFGESKNIADNYIKNCRALQTDVGSYITKVQLPSIELQSIIEKLDTSRVPNKLFEVLDFTDREIIHPQIAVSDIDKSYLDDYKDFLNVELLTSIKDLCYQSSLNNFDFYFNNFKMNKGVEFVSVKPRLTYFNSYIKKLKSILLEESPLEFIGSVTKLSSSSPKQSNTNEVIIEGEISNNKERVKVILNKQDYDKAIEAHRNELKVKVVGLAKESTTQYSIDRPETFEVIAPTSN